MYNKETIQTMRSAAINILIDRQTYDDTAKKINITAPNLKYFITTMMKGIRIRGKIMKVADVVRILGTSTNPVRNPIFASILIHCINQYERPTQGIKPYNKAREKNRNITGKQMSNSDKTMHEKMNVENDGYHRRLVGKKEKRKEKKEMEQGPYRNISNRNENRWGKKEYEKKGMKQAQYGNISTQNENRWDDINNNKAVIIENIDDETLMPNKVKKEELCFCLLEKNILKKKIALQSSPL